MVTKAERVLKRLEGQEREALAKGQHFRVLWTVSVKEIPCGPTYLATLEDAEANRDTMCAELSRLQSQRPVRAWIEHFEGGHAAPAPATRGPTRRTMASDVAGAVRDVANRLARKAPARWELSPGSVRER